MKTRKLRLLSFVLAVAMMFAVMPVSAFAEENAFSYPYEGKTLEYKIVGNETVEVSTNQSIKGSVKIPETVEHDGKPYTVVAIGMNAFFGDQQLTHVELPSTLKVIGENAFSCCKNLGDTVIPEGVTTINAYAFNMVLKATSYEIPASVTTIGGQAFANNTAKKIKFEKGSSITTLPYGLFAGNQFMEEVVLPEKLTEIGSIVFQYCKAMQSISLPSTVQKIGSQAFLNCYALDSITIPEQVAEISNDAFRNCSGLKTVYYDGNNENLFNQVNTIDPTKTTIKYLRHVSFVMNGHGTAPADQTVYTGDPIAEIAEPTAEGYNFAGWYTDKGLTKEFDVENDTISGDTTLYAKWDKIPDHQLTVTGGTFTVKDKNVETKTEGDTLMADIPEGSEVTVTFHKDAYADSNLTFDGWKIEGLVDAENYTNKEEFNFTMPKNGVTIAAQTKAAAPAEDDSLDAATVVTGVVLGTGTAILAYHIGTEVYAEQVLGKGVAIPRTREEVALKAWELAGKPAVELNGEPLSEAAQAEKWAVESGLMQNVDGSFNGSKKMSKLKALRTLDAAKKLG